MEHNYEWVFFNAEQTEDFAVDFTCEIGSENDGIGSYEYWGFKGYDRGETYLTLEDITWNKTLYTDEQNVFIDEYIGDNYSKMEKVITEHFAKNNAPDYDDWMMH
jgi:hypothetical protein